MSERITKFFKTLLPSPFTIAVLLTIVTFILALNITEGNNQLFTLLGYWETGLWNKDLLVFAIQMMLMLVLGHTLALTSPFELLINKVSKKCNSTANAAFLVAFFTLLVSFFNWGLGLIFGAIFARKVAEQSKKNHININYPIIGAAGYSGLMVWHGGISGSAPIKIAEEGHFLQYKMGVISQSQTIFSEMNLTLSVILLILIPSLMYLIGKKSRPTSFTLNSTKINLEKSIITGAEKLDHSKLLCISFASIILFYCIYKAFVFPEEVTLSIINPNFINLSLLALSLLFHKSFSNFLSGINHAIRGASGILIQFPLYFGIMGIMNESGIVEIMSSFFVNISTPTTFPLFTFLSAGIVNVFVPSGGGQWAVQGPIIIDAANQLGVPYWKSVMALAYGDQITNMLQPFWALPLLGITQLKAKEILPYTLILMLAGGSIFVLGLLIF